MAEGRAANIVRRKTAVGGALERERSSRPTTSESSKPRTRADRKCVYGEARPYAKTNKPERRAGGEEPVEKKRQ